jgi:hypothetical protein
MSLGGLVVGGGGTARREFTLVSGYVNGSLTLSSNGFFNLRGTNSLLQQSKQYIDGGVFRHYHGTNNISYGFNAGTGPNRQGVYVMEDGYVYCRDSGLGSYYPGYGDGIVGGSGIVTQNGGASTCTGRGECRSGSRTV